MRGEKDRSIFQAALEATKDFIADDIPTFFGETLPNRIEDELGIGGDTDATAPMRIGNRTVSIVPSSSRSGQLGRDIAVASTEAKTRSLVDKSIEAAGLGGLAAAQLAESFLYTPAFVVEFVRNPKGALKGVYDSAVYAVQNPTERPGDIVAMVWGGAGALAGLGSRVSRGTRGGLREAARPNPSSRQLPAPIRDAIPGSRSRQARRDRAVIAELRAADAAALDRQARKPVVARVSSRESSGNRRAMTMVVQDEAIRAVFDQTTPAERIRFFESERAKTKNAATARRLKRRIDANRIVEARGLVEGEPGSLRISPQHERLAALAEATRRVSDEQGFEKQVLGIVRKETQEARLSGPGKVIRGAEFQLENMAERFDRYSDRGRQFLVGAKVRPSDRSNLGTIVRLNDDGTADVHFINTRRGEAATKTFPLSELTPEGTKVGRLVGGTTEAGELVPGQTYGPYKIEQVGPPPRLAPAVNKILGRTRAPSIKQMTGDALRTGRYGSVVKLTAREALELTKYRERLELWKEAVTKSVSGAELLEQINTGRASLDDFIPVRVKPGTSTAPTLELIRFPADPNNTRVLDVFGSLDDAARERFAEIAYEADQSGQVQFVHKDIGVEPLRITPRGPLRSVAGLVNQAARFVTFYLGGPAYVVPNLIGQAGFLAMHQGLGTVPQLFWSAKVLRELPKGVERASFRRALQAVGGTGVTRAIMDGSGPIGHFYRANQWIGQKYAKILDDVWRENAVMYEARLRGHDSADSILKLVDDAKRNPQGAAARTVREIHDAVNENYGAFDRLSDFEKNTLTQLVFIYPWLKASFTYAVKLPVNHPAKAGALALGGTYANEEARKDFLRIFMDQGLSQIEAGQATDKLMSTMPGIFAIGDSAVSPLAVALLSTPSELGELADPFLRGDWKEAALGLLDVGTPSVSVFESAMRALFDQFSEGFGPEAVEALGSFSRDYTLFRRLAEGGTAWFDYSPGQAIAGRAAGSIAPRGVKGEGLLESVRRDQEAAGPPAQGYEESRFHRSRETRGMLFNRREQLQADIGQLDSLGFTPDEMEIAEQSLQVEFELENRLAKARKSGRLNYWAAAKAIRDYAIELFPNARQDVLRFYRNANTLAKRQEFYENLRAELREQYPWGNVHKYLEENG